MSAGCQQGLLQCDEAYELQESANQRFRQALSLHHTPGHIGELLDLRAGTKDAAEDGGSGSRGR